MKEKIQSIVRTVLERLREPDIEYYLALLDNEDIDNPTDALELLGETDLSARGLFEIEEQFVNDDKLARLMDEAEEWGLD